MGEVWVARRALKELSGITRTGRKLQLRMPSPCITAKNVSDAGCGRTGRPGHNRGVCGADAAIWSRISVAMPILLYAAKPGP